MRHLRWWVFSVFSFIVLALAAMFGFFQSLHESDITYIGFAIIAVYVVTTFWIGHKLYRRDLTFDFQHYTAEVMEKMGLVGTVVGLIIAFSALYNIDLDNPDDAKALIIQVVIGVLTALYTTLVGLVGSLFLKTQIAIIEMLEAENASEK